MDGEMAHNTRGDRPTRRIGCARNESGHGGGAAECLTNGPRARFFYGAPAAAASMNDFRRAKRSAGTLFQLF